LKKVHRNKHNSLSMSILEDVEVLDLLKTTDRGIKASKVEVENIDKWMIDKEQQYRMNALNDTRLYGYYDVSFVGTGKSQQGNPAGGRFRGGLGRMIYENEGLYQHIIKNSGRMGRETSVINVVKGRLLQFFALFVILDGFAKPLLLEERQKLYQKYGNKLTEGSVKAFFLPPLLGIGLYKSKNLFTFRFGPNSDVVLDTTYLDENFRLGRGSRGSTFIFKRLGELDSKVTDYQSVMANKPFNGRLLGVILTAIGALIIKLTAKNFISNIKFSLSKLLVILFSCISSMFGSITILLGVFLLFSKGGIIEENY